MVAIELEWGDWTLVISYISRTRDLLCNDSQIWAKINHECGEAGGKIAVDDAILNTGAVPN